jgi:hypothetical protein
MRESLPQGIDATTRGLAAVGAAAAGGGAVWYVALMQKVWAATAFGPICGHSDLLGPHCPSCYAALGLAGVGLAMLAAAESRRAVAAEAKPVR